MPATRAIAVFALRKTRPIVHSCCVETGGLAQHQFWNTYTGRESEGQLLPTDTDPPWSMAGLLRQYDPISSPNTTNSLPNGTFVPPYNGSNIGTFLEPFGRYDLLEYMNTYWIAWQQDNPGFWGHEFSKHATCFSTFNMFPATTAIKYYKRFPTFDWLAAKDITPSNSTTYSYSDLVDVLHEQHGGIPSLGCSGPRYNATEAGKNTD
ncbi:unnamed protein product [Alternaria alternata]